MQTQSAQKGKNQKAQPGPGKEVGKGGKNKKNSDIEN